MRMSAEGRKKGAECGPRDAKLFFFLCPFLIPRDEWEWKERTRPVCGADVIGKKSSAHLRNMFCGDVVGYSGKKGWILWMRWESVCGWSRGSCFGPWLVVCVCGVVAILWKVCSGWNYMFLLLSAVRKTKGISKISFNPPNRGLFVDCPQKIWLYKIKLLIHISTVSWLWSIIGYYILKR